MKKLRPDDPIFLGTVCVLSIVILVILAILTYYDI